MVFWFFVFCLKSGLLQRNHRKGVEGQDVRVDHKTIYLNLVILVEDRLLWGRKLKILWRSLPNVPQNVASIHLRQSELTGSRMSNTLLPQNLKYTHTG